MINQFDKIVGTFTLSDEQVHVFLVPFNVFNADDLLLFLSVDEAVRAGRLRLELKRRQFVITRALLKNLLAHCLNKKATEIMLCYAEHGKPYIDESLNHQAIQFNISHSGDYGLIAMTLKNEIGVDIEWVDPQIDYLALAKRFFSDTEQAALATLNNTLQLSTFYQIWTRKESFLKAMSQGASFGFDRFSVPTHTTPPRHKARMLTTPMPRDWFNYDLLDLKDYKTALTTNRAGLELIIHSAPDEIA